MHHSAARVGRLLQAINRAIAELTWMKEPLRTAQDVDKLSLGAKTADKVKEILATGAYARNEVLDKDERQQERADFFAMVSCV